MLHAVVGMTLKMGNIMCGSDILCFLCLFYFHQLEMFWKVAVRNVLESAYSSLGNKVEEINKVCKSAF